MSSNTARLDSFKLHSEFTDNSVTHRTIESDLNTGRRRTAIFMTWVHEQKLGPGMFGEVSMQREKRSGQLRTVKVVPRNRVKMYEMDALIALQDVRMVFWWSSNVLTAAAP